MKLSGKVGALLQKFYYLLDDSEEISESIIEVLPTRVTEISELTDALESELPARPGYVSSYPDTIKYAIEQLEDRLATATKRAVIAAKCVDALRNNLTMNSQVYTGDMVPNLTSISDVMTCTDKSFLESLESETNKQYMFAQVTDEDIATFNKLWNGEVVNNE